MWTRAWAGGGALHGIGVSDPSASITSAKFGIAASLSVGSSSPTRPPLDPLLSAAGPAPLPQGRRRIPSSSTATPPDLLIHGIEGGDFLNPRVTTSWREATGAGQQGNQTATNMDKMCRLAGDVTCTRKGDVDIFKLCFEDAAWKAINDKVVVLSKLCFKQVLPFHMLHVASTTM